MSVVYNLICLKMLRFLLFTCCCMTISLTHNINTKIGPILKTQTASSYFGFSATGVIDSVGEPWVAVGSPRANTSKLDHRQNNIPNKFGDKSTGALYKCPINMDPSNCVDITENIQTFPGKYYDPSNGWYGVSVAGGRQKDDKVMVCTHRPLVTYCGAIKTTECEDSLPGFCLILNKEDGTYDDEITTISTSNSKDFGGDGGIHISMSYERSRFGETGIGAAVQGDKCYSGAVGDIAWKGSTVTKDKKDQATDQTYSYGGYSLATGSFFSPDSNDFAIGAPRYNVTGAVFVKDSLSNPAKVIIRGEQYGSYFAMAICAGDFDGDKIFEIVVGAPYYTDSVSLPSSGKVYVYSSKNNFASPVQTYTAPTPQARALFGKAVAVIGDLDLSGYNDLIIGSPYEGEGGVVYIYHGSSDGLSAKPVQTIKASDFPNDLKTFGWSIRGETDLDSNGYPDIVVGAYTSDSIMILRTVPVVKVDIEYKLSSPTIDVSNKNCTVFDQKLGKTIQTVCFEVEVDASYVDRAGKMTDPIKISFQLDADTLVANSEKKRVRFESSQSSSLVVKDKFVKGNKITILKAKAYLRVDQCPDCEDKINPYPDIQLKVVAKLPEGRPEPGAPATSGDPPSLQPYFVLPYSTGEADVKNYTETKIQVKRACDPCKPNLMIKNTGTTKIPVQAKDIKLNVEVGNTADQGFDVTLTVDFPSSLRARPCGKDVECLYFGCVLYNNNSRMICDLGNFAKITKEYTIKVDTSEASNSLQTYLVTMNVTSANKEEASLLGDNSLSLKLNVASEANIEINSVSSPTGRYYGGSVRGQFSMTSEDQIGLKVNHIYTVSNQGPDLVPEVNITIEWPYQAKNGKHLLYLINITGDDIDSGKAECFPKPHWLNPLASRFTDDSNRVRRNADDSNKDSAAPAETPTQVRKGSASTVVLDCANGTAMCFSIPCTLSNIAKGKKVEIIMESRIWNGTLLEDYTDSDVQVISRGRIDDLTSYVYDANTEGHEVKTATSFYPDSPKTIKKDIAVWIIVVSAIAGVVLLIILVVVFKMCGFFNRSGGQRYDTVPEN